MWRLSSLDALGRRERFSITTLWNPNARTHAGLLRAKITTLKLAPDINQFIGTEAAS